MGKILYPSSCPRLKLLCRPKAIRRMRFELLRPMPRHADICGKRDLFVGASVLPMRFEFGNAPPSRCFQCYRRSQICRRLSSRIPFIYAFRVHGFSAIERVSLYTPLECLVRFIPSEQKSGQYSEQRVSFVGYQNQLPSPQHQAVSTRD